MRSLVIVIVKVIVLVNAGCGGGGDGGAGVGGDGGPDATAPVVGDGGPGGVFDEPASGQFEAVESRYAQGEQNTWVHGSLLHPRPVSHELTLVEGECRMWVHHAGDCGEECIYDGYGGVCGPDGTCEPYPAMLSAGDVVVSAPGGSITLADTEVGYHVNDVIDGDLAAPGEAVTLSAPGGDDVGAFQLEAAGVEPITLALEDAGGGEANAIRLVDGGDAEFTWQPAAGGARVRLDLMTDNTGHGLPVLEWIECDSPDDGLITVPRAMVEAMPDKIYSDVCAGTDCPFSELTRYKEDRATVGEHEVALRVSSQHGFILVVGGEAEAGGAPPR